jgi:hypothetical protein
MKKLEKTPDTNIPNIDPYKVFVLFGGFAPTLFKVVNIP